MKIIIGIDPDSNKSGFALYANGKLERLECKTLIEIHEFFRLNMFNSAFTELHIEDLNANNCSSFNHNKKMSQGAKFKVSESVGKCKQVQIEIERIAIHFDVKIVKHKVSSQWKGSKTGKKILERSTGWKSKSNEDSRSAAYFGFLGCK